MLVPAKQAAVSSIRNRAANAATRKRNKRAAAAKQAAQERQSKQWWFEEETKEIEGKIAKAIKRGGKLVRHHVVSLRESGVSVTKAMKDADPIYKKIFYRLRHAGYRIVIKVKSQYHSGSSPAEGIPDTDPWTTYEYTAFITW